MYFSRLLSSLETNGIYQNIKCNTVYKRTYFQNIFISYINYYNFKIINKLTCSLFSMPKPCKCIVSISIHCNSFSVFKNHDVTERMSTCVCDREKFMHSLNKPLALFLVSMYWSHMSLFGCSCVLNSHTHWFHFRLLPDCGCPQRQNQECEEHSNASLIQQFTKWEVWLNTCCFHKQDNFPDL